MEEQQTADLEAENQGKKDTSETDTQTDENAEGGDVDKQEGENQYEVELKRLEDEKRVLQEAKAKQDEIIEHKNRAIETEKQRRRDLEAKINPSEDEIDALLDKKLNERLKTVEERLVEAELNRKINSITADLAEQKLIRHHYLNSITRSGDLDRDLTLAVGAANATSVMEERKRQALEENRQEWLVGFQGTTKKDTGEQKFTDPILKEAADLVRRIKPEAVKYLKR